jgi:hypothetical protein
MVSYPLLPDRLQKVVLLNMEVSGDKKLIWMQLAAEMQHLKKKILKFKIIWMQTACEKILRFKIICSQIFKNEKTLAGIISMKFKMFLII